MRFNALVPMLQTDNVDQTREWYESLLGFRCESVAADWCRLERDDVAIMFMKNDHLGLPSSTITHYIYVDEVMALFETLRDQCRIEWGPEEMPYGMLEFAIRDPNGYLLSFGQPTESSPSR